jgi:hypothetical protein
MLILPPGHAENVQRLRPLTVRERWLVRGMLAAMALMAVGVVIALATSSQTSAHGCIHVTIPGPVGADEIDQCGAQARDICATVLAPGAFSSLARADVVAGCRKAGLPVG